MGSRPAICALLCELYLSDAIPETVVHDCLCALLWNVRAAQPAMRALPPRCMPGAACPPVCSLATRLCCHILCSRTPHTLALQIQDPHPGDIECACTILQSVGPLLDASSLGEPGVCSGGGGGGVCVA